MSLPNSVAETKFNMVYTYLKEKYVQNGGIINSDVLNELKQKINNSRSTSDNSTLMILNMEIENYNNGDVSNAEIIIQERLSNDFNIDLDNENTLHKIISNSEYLDAADYCNQLINNTHKSIMDYGTAPENSKIIIYEKNIETLLFIFYKNNNNKRNVIFCSCSENNNTRSACPVVKSGCPFMKSSCPVVKSGCPVDNEYCKYQLDLRVLYQNNPLANPFGDNFNYAKEFSKLNLADVKKDLAVLLTTSQSFWPADFGHYGPFIIRLAWHSAGTYRIGDGRGGGGDGSIRFPPLNSWPDNGNLDKARRLLWSVKKKYGSKISWSDLIIFAGTVALEIMGVPIIGFGGGREDTWEVDYYTYWGSETKMLDNSKRYTPDGQLEKPLAASQIGLIYVNPEGPNGNPDPIAAAHDIRTTFGRMGMNDAETVALIGGGHSFGKCHGAASTSYVGPAPDCAPIQQMGLGWKNSFRLGKGPDTITSGLEVTWTKTPTVWSNFYFESLFEYNWELIKSPAGANQWIATNAELEIPDAFDPNVKHFPTMLTTDLSLLFDPDYHKISRHYLDNPDIFTAAFAKAWFKLTHRDMGPKWNYLGQYVPIENFIWQDPVPPVQCPLVNSDDITYLKKKIVKSGLTIYELVYTAWSSASTYRKSDKRGGSNGARIRLTPMKFWNINQPQQLSRVLSILESIQTEFNNRQSGIAKISLADLIILGGAVGIELAAKAPGKDIKVPFTPGRTDASQEETDIDSFNVLEPKADGFRNYIIQNLTNDPERLLIDKAELLSLTGPELTVLLGGLRVMGINFGKSTNGVLTKRPGTLTTDFFTNILDINIVWSPRCKDPQIFNGTNRNTAELMWTATKCDLVFGSNDVLRAYCEVYAADDAKDKFINDFIAAWNKVMDFNLPPILCESNQ